VRNLGLKPKKSPTNMSDSLDMQIIRTLEDDSRLSLRKLAQKVGVTPNILRNHLQALEQKGVILGYIPIVDSAKMG